MKARMIIPLDTDFSLDGYICSMTKGPKAVSTKTGEAQATGPASVSAMKEKKQKAEAKSRHG